MRGKIQGVVVLACVVQADGTVGAVQVRQSLGFGLDEQAIVAVRRWKFAAGTRDGVAVPVAVTVNVAFSIRGVSPPSTLPEAFVTAVTAESGWTEDVVQAEGLEIRFAYPAGWSVSKDVASTNRLATLYHETGARSLFIGRPRTLAAAPPQPLPIGDVQRFADGMMRMPLLASGKLERRAFGQGLIGDRWWIWLDLQTTTLPPEIAQAANGAFDGSRMWVFVTMIGAQELTVFCNRLLLAGSSVDDTATLIKQTGAELSGLLHRISIQARHP
jgi:protein TonB